MLRISRFSSLFALLCLLPACHWEIPSAPEPLVGGYEPEPAPQPEPVGYPPLAGPARVFEYDAEATNSSHASTWNVNTRYVLYDDGTFALQFQRTGASDSGSYTEKVAGEVLFSWYTERGMAKEATGRLEGDLLHIEYGFAMAALAGFVNGTYRLVQ